MLLTKDFETVQERVQPQDPDLLAIRKYAQRDLAPDDVWCSAFKVCNTKVDRSGERFTKAYLERFRETIVGKGVLEGHRRDIRPLGRVYGAEVLPDGQDWYLKGYWYTLADSPIRREVELGIARDCSIGYAAGKRTCGICSKTWLPYRQGDCKDHQPLQEYDGKPCVIHYCDTEAHKAEAQEVSLVWLGCQYGAEATAKQFAEAWQHGIIPREQVQRFYALGGGITLPFPPTAPRQEESGMFDTLEKAVAEIERLKALPLADAERKQFQDQITELKAKAALADDGLAYRTHLKAEMKRLAGALDEARKSKAKTEFVDALLAQMGEAPVEALTKFLAPLQEEFDQVFAQGAAHGNGPGDENREKKKSSPFGRLAMGGLR